MPTGFTAPIYNGEDITFEQFANSCLRNFGIYLRFEGKYPNLGRYEVPEKIYPSDYHKKKYEEAKAEYEKHLATPKTKEELEAEYLSYVKDVIKGNEDRLKKNEVLKNRYNAMLSKVRRWTPPSKDHEGIKDFMESQLIDSLDFDCRHVYVENIIPKDEWIQKQANALIYALFVDDTHRRCGVAKRLLQLAEQQAKLNGVKTIGLEFNKDESESFVLEWYLKNGYKPFSKESCLLIKKLKN